MRTTAQRAIIDAVPEGRIDPITYTILGRNIELYAKLGFDWVVEGTSFLFGYDLYIESSEESRVKSAVLREVSGKKILVLTGHEAVAEAPAGREPFGRIDEYDFIVLPHVSRDDRAMSRFDLAIHDIEGSFEPWIVNWNYEILKLRRRAKF